MGTTGVPIEPRAPCGSRASCGFFDERAPDESEQFRTVAGLRLWDAAERRPGDPIYGVFPPPPYLAQWLALRAGRELAPGSWRPLVRVEPARPGYDGYPYARLGGLLWAALTLLALCSTARHWTRSAFVSW